MRLTNTTRDAGTLGRKLVSGIVWLLAQNLASRVINLVGQLVAAAILLPREFGLIGLAYTVMAIGLALSDFGIEQVLIQRQRTLYLWITPAFWLSLALGLAGATAMLIAAPLATHLYRAPGLTGLIVVLATAIPLMTLGTVPTTLLRAAFRFRLIAGVTLFESVMTQVLTIVGLLAGLGTYGLVLPVPIVAALRVMLLWRAARPRLRARLQPQRWLRVIGDSSTVFASKLIIAAVNQGDYMILGLLGSTTTVGNYFFAFKLAVQPVQVLAGNLTNVLLPTLSQYRDDPMAQGEAAMRVARLLGIAIMPFAFCEVAAAPPVIHLVFGHKWDEAIPLIEILCVALAFDSVAWIAGTLLLASRRYRTNLIYLAVISPLFFLFVWLGGRSGSATGVAIAVTFYYAVITPFYSYATFRGYGVSGSRVVMLYGVPASVAAAAFAVGKVLANSLGFDDGLGGALVVIAVEIVLYGAVYARIDPMLADYLVSRFHDLEYRVGLRA